MIQILILATQFGFEKIAISLQYFAILDTVPWGAAYRPGDYAKYVGTV